MQFTRRANERLTKLFGGPPKRARQRRALPGITALRTHFYLNRSRQSLTRGAISPRSQYAKKPGADFSAPGKVKTAKKGLRLRLRLWQTDDGPAFLPHAAFAHEFHALEALEDVP